MLEFTYDVLGLEKNTKTDSTGAEQYIEGARNLLF
jgi:hypothetical protein